MRSPGLPQRPSRLLVLLGGSLALIAAAWWAIVFTRVLANGYLSAGEAVSCSVASSVLCDLAMSLCGQTHPLGVAWYSPALLWVAVGLLSVAALITPAGRPK